MIECHSTCPTYYGRKNKKGDAVEMLKVQKEMGMSKAAYDKLSDEEKEKHYPIGTLTEYDYPEFTDLYDEIIKAAQADAAGK